MFFAPLPFPSTGGLLFFRVRLNLSPEGGVLTLWASEQHIFRPPRKLFESFISQRVWAFLTFKI